MTHTKTAAEEAGPGPDSKEARWAIREMKVFFDSYWRSVHSLILFGSYALGKATLRSDIDFLVLLKDGEDAKRLRRILFDFKMVLGDAAENKLPVEIQIVDFAEKEIEQIFKLATPLAHAVRHGVFIRDDGWLKRLLGRPYPRWPTKEAAVVAFTRWIIWQYYRCAIDLRREIARDHGPEGICERSGECVGHFSGDILARVISRMLYVTLPERGILPLCKSEALTMAEKSYGPLAKRPVNLAVDILRDDRAITAEEFRSMMPFARRLFRECIRICGPRDPRVVETLRHQAEFYRGVLA